MQETQLNGESLDIVSENVSKLKELFPEILTENKIDFDKLKEVLGKYTEDDNERYNFTWKGKSAALRLAQTPSSGTLRPCKEESKNWDTTENLYIEGDNLEVLKLLQKSYYGKIKMIYIDPPYNTGKDFVYKDNYQDNLQNYLEMTGQVDYGGKKISTNTDAGGRYHTNWLNMMYPRLILARNLLVDNGVVFISIDDNEVENLKKVCNEIYGEENFVIELPRLTKKGGKSTDSIARNHDYVLVYCKYKKNLTIKGLKHFDKGFSNKDEFFEERGYYKLNQTLDYNSLQYNKKMDYVIEIDGISYCPGGSLDELEKRHNGIHKRIDWVWRWSYEKFKFGYENGFIVIKDTGKNRPRIYTKTYLNAYIDKNELGNYFVKIEERTKPISSIELVNNHYSNDSSAKELKGLLGDSYFEYIKPIKLISLFCKIATENDDIILDYFSGSSTTANSVMQINAEDKGNRKFIMVQLPEKTIDNSEAMSAGYKNICEIGKERIRRAGDKIVSEMNQNGQISLDNKTNNNLDIGFKVFKLDSSNLVKWDPEYDNLEQTLLDSVKNLVSGRNELDLVYEIMLKSGIDLTLQIEEYPIQDKKFYSIGFGALIICLDDNLTSRLASEIIRLKDELSPEVMRVVFKDNGFASDSDKTNIKETLKTHGIEEFVTI